jgi:hypothetical protein
MVKHYGAKTHKMPDGSTMKNGTHKGGKKKQTRAQMLANLAKGRKKLAAKRKKKGKK